MKTIRTIAALENELKLFVEREKGYLELIRRQSDQIRSLSGQVERLSVQLAEQSKTIASLEEALLQKEKDVAHLSGKNRGLSKLLAGNASEKIVPAATATPAEETPAEKRPLSARERGNNGSKRKEHFELEEVLEEVWPENPSFDKSEAHVISHVDSIRYSYIPPRFIKRIIRRYNCVIGEQVFTAPLARTPQMNSNYDASFIAGIISLRYIYSMPVERIIKLFTENGFELNKPTAHALLSKTSILLEALHEVLRRAIHTDPYIRMDETYHNVLVEEKNSKGKRIRKSYFWAAMATHLKLIQFIYKEGSREKTIFLDYLDSSYRGAVHTDGLACYKAIETEHYPHAIRLSCIQHAKRKFIDVGKDEQAEEIIAIINELYQIEHAMPLNYPPEKKHRQRNKKAPPVLKKLKAKLQSIKDDPLTLPSTPLAAATNYLLNEFNAVENYLLAPDYTLDNNPQEYQNRYISLSRRNSLFFGSHEGAKRSALLYSLACSCRMNEVNVFEYFNDILTRMPYLPPNASYEVLRDLLPDKWQKLS